MICPETPFATCDSCGWHGNRVDLVERSTAVDEACPECLSDRTWWVAHAPGEPEPTPNVVERKPGERLPACSSPPPAFDWTLAQRQFHQGRPS